FGMKVGGVAGPLRARDGWYFLRVNQGLPPDEKAFDALRGQLTSQLLQQKQQSIFARWIQASRDRAEGQELPAGLGTTQWRREASPGTLRLRRSGLLRGRLLFLDLVRDLA